MSGKKAPKPDAPHYEDAWDDYCQSPNKVSPSGFYCTRKNGHPPPHRAYGFNERGDTPFEAWSGGEPE